MVSRTTTRKTYRNRLLRHGKAERVSMGSTA